MRILSQLRKWWLWPARVAGRLTEGRRCRHHVPVVCNGKGRVVVHDRVSFGYQLAPRMGNGAVLLQARTPAALIEIGTHTRLSNNVSIIACTAVTLGEECLIGDGVSIMDSDFHRVEPARRRETPENDAPVSIGRNVWLGNRVMVLKGVSIGDNSVIAAGAVVTRSIPENCLAAGNPARVIRSIQPPPP